MRGPNQGVVVNQSVQVWESYLPNDGTLSFPEDEFYYDSWRLLEWGRVWLDNSASPLYK